MSIQAVQIIDANSKLLVEAEIHDELSVEALLDIEEQWTKTRNDVRMRLSSANVPESSWPESLHWDWALKSLTLGFGDREDFRIFGVRRGSDWQGAMVTRRKLHLAKLVPDTGKPLIYVDYVEVAPWNWTVREIQQARQFKAVGPLLLRAAVIQSEAEGYQGRIGLHALPQAESFYRNCGLAFATFDADKGLPTG